MGAVLFEAPPPPPPYPNTSNPVPQYSSVLIHRLHNVFNEQSTYTDAYVSTQIYTDAHYTYTNINYHYRKTNLCRMATQ